MVPLDDLRCPKCGEERQIERIGRDWFCAVCAHHWPAAIHLRPLVTTHATIWPKSQHDREEDQRFTEAHA